jgi:hypothetical protein
MENRVEMVGYAAIAIAGLSITTSLLSLGFITDVAPVPTTVTLGAFGVSLFCLGLFAVWSGQRQPHAIARLSNRETPAGPRDGA